MARGKQRRPGKKSYNPKDREKCDDKKEMKDDDRRPSRSNDPDWYAQTPELMRDAASLPFSNAAGVQFSLDVTFNDSGYVVQNNTVAVPGILVEYVVPCPGQSYSVVSAINNAATAMYSFVRHANSGSANYDSPDLMIYALAMGQVYSYLNFLQRIYGTCQLYSNYNRFMPRAIIESQGVSYDDLISNLADFRYGVNSLIHKAASLACPAEMPYFRRLAFLFSGLYSEGESIKDQLYMYSPAGFMQFSETADTDGGSLQFVKLWRPGDTSRLTVQQLITYGEDLLQPIIASEDMNIMSGDILKAYGMDRILKLQTLPEVFTILPTTDLTVLEQMQNANWISSNVVVPSVTQNVNKNAIIVRVQRTGQPMAQLDAFTNRHVLTTILTDPTPADVMERTRMMANYVTMPADPASSTVTEVYTGTEYVETVWIYNLDSQGHTYKHEVPSIINISTTITPVVAAQNLNMHCMLENFKFHPGVAYFTQVSDNTHQFLNLALDFDNFAIVNNDVLERMHEAAMLSLFNVSSIARF